MSGAFVGIMSLITLLGLVRRSLPALAVVFAIGTRAALINVLLLTYVQVSAPSRARGRLIGLVLAMAGAATPLGLASGGVIADLTGRRAPATFVTVGLIGLGLVAFAVTRPSFRDADQSVT